MPILRTLLFEAIKRAALDPKLRAQALQTYRETLQPHVGEAARKGRGAAEQLGAEWRDTTSEIDPKREPARFAGRLAGRLRRRLREPDQG